MDITGISVTWQLDDVSKSSNNRMTNCVDFEQYGRDLCRMILVRTVCSDLSVRIYSVNTTWKDDLC